jgi:ferredoxin
MTRVVVDREVCMGAGVCEMEAPEVFELDADGVLQVHQPTDAAAVETAAVETAVRACPTGALQLVD